MPLEKCIRKANRGRDFPCTGRPPPTMGNWGLRGYTLRYKVLSMSTPPAGLARPAGALEDAPALHAGERRVAVTALARTILAYALLLGVAADLLIRDGFTGLGFPTWLALLAIGIVSLVGRADRRLPRESAAWLAVAVLFGAGMAWRDDGLLQFLDFVATLFALGMAVIALGDERSALLAARMRDTVWAAAAVIRSIVAGLFPFVLRDGAVPVPSGEMSGRVRPAARALLIALPLVLVFGSLLRDADPLFASLIAFPDLDLGRILSHVIPIGFFTWVVAGWARAGLIADLGRHRAPDRTPFSLGMLDVTAALGVLDVLFALYVATQLGWFFGGERFLQERTGLTAAQYARQGFFQMVWVVLLVVPLLLGTRAALRPGRELERRHTALALPLLALLGAMIVSAMLRMRLYVQYYGLTTDRFYPIVFMGWLAVVLVWLALTVRRGNGRAFAAGAVITGLMTLAALNVAAPEVIVARANLTRAEQDSASVAPQLDVAYLAQLGGEAAPYAVAAVLAPPAGAPGSAERSAADAARCRASTLLLGRWQRRSERQAQREAEGTAWRQWNRGEAVAMDAVGAQAASIRAVQHETCPRGASRGGVGARPLSAPAGR